ncbi:hypothetical protein IEO21_08908 [Rhodonia placenta]|uniref:Uncharacterized protein n=1 Tax=Rhodonia placenta TaxID=104341 RepID=A0A8H7TYD9_9APHY|nr:hypothetical protein IEO21_08908 [Postia placenta]
MIPALFPKASWWRRDGRAFPRRYMWTLLDCPIHRVCVRPAHPCRHSC